MSLVNVNDAGVLRGVIRLPLKRAWTAELVLDIATPPSGKVVLAAVDGLALHGAVVFAGEQLDAAHVLLVGGAGGLNKIASGTWRQGQVRDPLDAIAKACGESLSSAIAGDVSSAQVPFWSIVEKPGALLLDELMGFASELTSKDVHWRILTDGTVWCGAEDWPKVKLLDGDDVLDFFPSERRYVIGPTTPSLLPGVDLDGVGKVIMVEHWIEPSAIRTFAWVA